VNNCATIKPPTMAMPSAGRSSKPGPVPIAIGTALKIAASMVMVIGLARSRAASRIASRALSCRLRSASSAKSTIMMAFFMTMPTSRMQAIEVTRVNWIFVAHSASSAPNTLVAIYIALGVLYESYIHPLTILSILPPTVFGALLGAMGDENPVPPW